MNFDNSLTYFSYFQNLHHFCFKIKVLTIHQFTLASLIIISVEPSWTTLLTFSISMTSITSLVIINAHLLMNANFGPTLLTKIKDISVFSSNNATIMKTAHQTNVKLAPRIWTMHTNGWTYNANKFKKTSRCL